MYFFKEKSEKMLQFIRFFGIIKIREFYDNKGGINLGTYNLPRNVKGEGRILYVFSTKALLYTFGGIGIGFVFYLILSAFGLEFVAFLIMVILGGIGFLIATFKVPESSAFKITKNTGGENIDDVIRRAIKFKMQKNKVYVYKESTKEKLVVKNGGEK